MLEQDAVNSYVFKLAPKKAEAIVLSEKLMWGAPFPVPAHSRNRFYQAVSSRIIASCKYMPLHLFLNGFKYARKASISSFG